MQGQVHPLSPLHCTYGSTSSASGWGRSDEGGDGYHSDPAGSGQSDQSRLSLVQTELQPLDNILLARVEKLERQHIKQERKIEQLERMYSDLETCNNLLNNDLDEKSAYITELEKKLGFQETRLFLTEQDLKTLKVDLENQKRKLEDAVQTIQSINTDGQAPPPNSDSQDRFEPVSRRLKNIEDTFTREFSANFGTANREDKLDTLIDELKSKIDDLTSGRSQSQPQCTPWQHWKSEACTIIGTSRQG